MKHPGHKNAKNQYEGRAGAKLSKEGKENLKKEMKRFSERLKELEKKRNNP